jgi:hypothetical protein
MAPDFKLNFKIVSTHKKLLIIKEKNQFSPGVGATIKKSS